MGNSWGGVSLGDTRDAKPRYLPNGASHPKMLFPPEQQTIPRLFQQHPIFLKLFHRLPQMILRPQYIANAPEHQLERKLRIGFLRHHIPTTDAHPPFQAPYLDRQPGIPSVVDAGLTTVE